jgi:hypothetical protein
VDWSLNIGFKLKNNVEDLSVIFKKGIIKRDELVKKSFLIFRQIKI